MMMIMPVHVEEHNSFGGKYEFVAGFNKCKFGLTSYRNFKYLCNNNPGEVFVIPRTRIAV